MVFQNGNRLFEILVQYKGDMIAVVNGLNVGNYIQVLLVDGSVFEGEIVSLGVNHMIVDDVRAFGDMIGIEYKYIVDIRVR